MTREEVYERLNKVFQDVFDDESIIVNDNTTSNDIDGWDSLIHITLIGSIEEEFRIKLSMKEVLSIKNVGELINIIANKILQ